MAADGELVLPAATAIGEGFALHRGGFEAVGAAGGVSSTLSIIQRHSRPCGATRPNWRNTSRCANSCGTTSSINGCWFPAAAPDSGGFPSFAARRCPRWCRVADRRCWVRELDGKMPAGQLQLFSQAAHYRLLQRDGDSRFVHCGLASNGAAADNTPRVNRIRRFFATLIRRSPPMDCNQCVNCGIIKRA